MAPVTGVVDALLAAGSPGLPPRSSPLMLLVACVCNMSCMQCQRYAGTAAQLAAVQGTSQRCFCASGLTV